MVAGFYCPVTPVEKAWVNAMTDKEFLADLNNLLAEQQSESDQRRRTAIEAEWKQFGEIQDKDLLLRIGYSSSEFFDNLLAGHPAKKLWDSVENVRRAFDILNQSRAAIVDLVGKFHSRVVHNLYGQADWEPALSEATKEVYTYSSAAVSLVQAYRHMISGNDKFVHEYDKLRADIFKDSTIVRFFSDLRNSNNHIHILAASPHYTITTHFKGEREVRSGIRFNREMILKGDHWTAESKSFVTTRDNLEVVKLIDEHFNLASYFKDIVLFRTGVHSDKGYRDIGRIQNARSVMGNRISLGILLQMAVSKKINPYEYLHKWFTDDELKNIYSFGDHTKEQLEYMISLRDPFGFCDRDTREKLYKLFSVPLDLLPDQAEDEPRADF